MFYAPTLGLPARTVGLGGGILLEWMCSPAACQNNELLITEALEKNSPTSTIKLQERAQDDDDADSLGDMEGEKCMRIQQQAAPRRRHAARHQEHT